nr:homolog of EHV2 ORF11 virion protein G11 [Macronycteris gammaherpesvirus 1]
MASQNSKASTLKKSFIRRKTNVSTTLSNFWEFAIFETYVKISNFKKIDPDSTHTSELPCLPSLSTIVQSRYPDYMFTSSTFGGNCSKIVFILVGSSKNSIFINPVIICSSNTEIFIQTASPVLETIQPNDLTFYVFPVNLIKPHGLFLKIVKDENPTRASTTCSQECAHITSKEPQVFLCGNVTVSDGHRQPFLFAQKNSLFNKKYCRLHGSQGVNCPVNCVKKGRHFIRVCIEESFFKGDLTSCIRVGATLVDDVILAFKYNPYFQKPWDWNSLYTPIDYVGTPVIIPAGQTAQIEYKNMYYAPLLPEITALITNVPGNSKFQIYDCEWSPKSSVVITVKNISCCLQLLKNGDSLGQAFFFIAPKIHLANMLPTKYRDNMSAAFSISGGLMINATKLHKLSKVHQRCFQ